MSFVIVKLATNHIHKIRNSQSIERTSQASIDHQSLGKVSQSDISNCASVDKKPNMIVHMLSEPQSIKIIRNSNRKSYESSLSPILRKNREMRQSFEESQEILLDKYGDPIN